MLEDLIVAAVNAAARKADDAHRNPQPPPMRRRHNLPGLVGSTVCSLLSAALHVFTAPAGRVSPTAAWIDELRKLPGVGTRTAQRFAFHILRSPDDDAAALADAIRATSRCKPAALLHLQQHHGR